MKKSISILLPISIALILLTLLLGVVSAAGSRKNSPLAVNANGIKSDDFNQAALAPFWTHTQGVAGDPDPVMNGSEVEIAVPAGPSHNIWTDGNKSSRIMQPAPDSDFEVEVKFTSGVNSVVSDTFRMQGILVEQDVDDFLRFEFFGENGSTYAYGAEFENGDVIWTKKVNIQPGGTAPIYLRIERQGNNYFYRYGLDGSSWSQVFTRTLTRTLTVNNIGIYAANHSVTPDQAPAHTTVADYFYNTDNLPPFDLTVTEIGNGSVTKVPDLTDYEASQLVTLTPNPDPDWVFDSWSGPDAVDVVDNGNGTWSLTMDDDKSVTATFVTSYTLDVIVVGNGSVSLAPPGGTYTQGTVVTLTPTADPGSSFVNWSGPDAGDLIDNGNGTWSITMDANKSVTANFEGFTFRVYVPVILKP